MKGKHASSKVDWDTLITWALGAYIIAFGLMVGLLVVLWR